MRISTPKAKLVEHELILFFGEGQTLIPIGGVVPYLMDKILCKTRNEVARVHKLG